MNRTHSVRASELASAKSVLCASVLSRQTSQILPYAVHRGSYHIYRTLEVVLTINQYYQ